MTKEKCKEVLDFYRNNLAKFYFETMGADLPVAKKAPENEEMELAYGGESYFNFETEEALVAHLLYMFDEMEKMLIAGKMEKFFRWLGFVQGACWVLGYQSLEEMKNLNRPDPDCGEATVGDPSKAEIAF